VPAMPDPTLVDRPADLFMATMLLSQQLAQGQGVAPDSEGDSTTLLEVGRLYEALGQDRYAALRAALSISPDLGINRTDASVLASGRDILGQRQPVRYLVMGHTHEEGRWGVDATRAILNTGTWFPRKALPHEDAFTPEYSAWATQPTTLPYPGADGQRFISAWLRSEPGAATVAELVAWASPAREGPAPTPPFTPVPDDAMERW
jgi:hypothetical protein